MKVMKKRVFSFALAAMMLLTGMTIGVKAESTQEDGTVSPASQNMNFYAEDSMRYTSTDSSISDMYNVPVTYYDYLDDQEVINGWKNIKPYGNNRQDGWSVFGSFNKALAAYYKEQGLTTTGVYFGNLLGSAKAGAGVGKTRGGEVDSQIQEIKTIYDNYGYNANNSNYLPSYMHSAQGLVYNTLDEEGYLQIADGISAPWFDETFLSMPEGNHTLGKVFSSRFPFRSTTDGNGVSYYEFDSNAGKDNVWYDRETETFYYGAGKENGVHDFANKDWGTKTDSENEGYGFFPFNRNNGAYNDGWLDFGFGAKMEIRFNLPKGGTVKGTNGQDVPVTFEFTGDDDVWIFIDGKLVLDLGGAHKKAQGTINFSDMSVNIQTGTEQINTGSEMNAVSLQEALGVTSSDDFTPNQAHTMTIFYMERGMIESNLKIRFNMQPLDHEFIAEKEVAAEQVNIGIQEVVKNADEFNIELKVADTPASGKSYQLVDGATGETKQLTTDTGGNFTLRDQDQAVFKKQFDNDRGKQFTATETTKDGGQASYLMYDTNWVVEDLETGAKPYGLGDSKIASFPYNTTSTDPFTPVRLKLKYMNTPKIGSLSVTKTTVDIDGGPYEDKGTEFKFVVELDMGIKSEGKYVDQNRTDPTAIYFKKPADWQNVYAYCYNSETDKNAAWPGVQMTQVSSEEDIYKLAKMRGKYDSVVFTNGNGQQYPAQNQAGATIYDESNLEQNYYEVTGSSLTVSKYAEIEQQWQEGAPLGYAGYPLEYTVNGAGKTTTAGGQFTLKSGETAEFPGIPLGTKFRIKEVEAVGYTLKEMEINGTSTDPSEDGAYIGEIKDPASAVVEVVNQKEETAVNLNAWKTLDSGESELEEGQFSFSLTGKTPERLEDGTWTENTSSVQQTGKKNDKKGKIAFETLTYQKEGTYLYTIKEEIPESDKTFVYDKTEYEVKVVVTASEGKMTPEVTVMKVKDKEGDDLNPPEEVTDIEKGIKFDNVTNTSTLTVQKLLVKEDGSSLQKEFWPDGAENHLFKFKLEILVDGKWISCRNQKYIVKTKNGDNEESKENVTSDEGYFELMPQEKAGDVIVEFPELIIGTQYRISEDLSDVERYQFHSVLIDGAQIYKKSEEKTYSSGDLTIKKETTAVVFNNYPLSVITVEKKDEEHNPLAGATFELKDQDGNIVISKTSGADGNVVFDNLHEGTYEITEVKTDEDHVLLKEPIEVTVPYEYKAGDIVNGSEVTSDGWSYKVKFTVVNEKGFDLPESGRKGITPYLMGGVALAVTAGAVLGLRMAESRKKHQGRGRRSK